MGTDAPFWMAILSVVLISLGLGLLYTYHRKQETHVSRWEDIVLYIISLLLLIGGLDLRIVMHTNY